MITFCECDIVNSGMMLTWNWRNITVLHIHYSLSTRTARAHTHTHVHLYADYTQLYLAFRPHLDEDTIQAVKLIQDCVAELQDWMNINKLKCNATKAEIIMMCAPHKIKLSMPHTKLGNTVVPVSTVAKNIGVFSDDALSMNNQAQHICRVAYFHIHGIGKIRNLLDRKTTEIMIHTYVTSRHDNGNSLLYGISDHLLTRLQRVQNAAAHLITRMKKHDHITPVLIDLHWLSIKQRIEYKLLLLTWTSCIIHNRPTNSLRTDPCATLRGRSPTGGSTMQTTYAGRKGIFECCSTPLEQSAACHACHRLPQFVQEAIEDITV